MTSPRARSRRAAHTRIDELPTKRNHRTEGRCPFASPIRQLSTEVDDDKLLPIPADTENEPVTNDGKAYELPPHRSENATYANVPAGAASILEPTQALPRGRDEIRNTVIPRLIRWRNRREPLVCRIAESLASDIVFQKLTAGEALNSVDLARRFGVSRTPVREALALLEQEGLVEIQARRTARVASLEIAEVREIYELRAHLLSLAVRQLVMTVTDEQLEILGRCVARMRLRVERHDYDGYFAEHVGIQDLITEFSGNRTLKRVLDSLALRVLVMRYMTGSVPGRIELGILEQEQLFRAIATRDPDLAAAAIAYPIRQAFRTLESVLVRLERDHATAHGAKNASA